MQFDVAALPAEDLEPLAKALSLAPPEKRGEVYMRIQNAGREFLAKATAGKPPSAATETDPIKRAVFGALTKQLPAPAPQLDPLKREALGSLEKAVMAGIRGAARGVGDALGVTGRAGAMRQMRAGYKQFSNDFKRAESKYSSTSKWLGRNTGITPEGIDRISRSAGRAGAKVALQRVNRRRNNLMLGAALGAGATYAATRPSKQKDQ
jgi:hypothetical protein